MNILKKYKKVFIGIAIGAACLAAIPIAITYMVINSNIGIEEGDSVEVIQEKINSYFEGNGLTEDIINSMRNKTTGDFNLYTLNPNSDSYNEIESKMGMMLSSAMELNRLEEGKKYNIKVYSDFYEGENKISTEELMSKDIVGSDKFHIIYGDKFMNGGSKRDTTLYFVQNKELVDTLNYYIPTNYNECGTTVDADFNINEDIPMMSFTRGYKVDGKYKTYSPALHKDKLKAEESIQKNLSKNEKMVILRLEVNEIL